MDNQHRKIKGYRELSQVEIDLMNEIKTKGAELGELVAKLNLHISDQLYIARDDSDIDEVERLHAADPINWLLLGKSKLQEGLMALTRSIAQPTFF